MTVVAAERRAAPSRPPVWLLLATGLLALTVLALAVAETDLKAHYLIDQGEFISVFGLAFIVAAGVYLYTRSRLYVSLPLVFPWLLYPIITQGDQIIDNLSINPMRVICHVLLAAIFATPVAVVVAAVRYVASRAGSSFGPRAARWLTVALLASEMWLAYRYLGLLMIVTLAIMIAGVLLYGALMAAPADERARRTRSERFALGILLVGVAVSFAGYYGYKNRPGAYQGSPSFFLDPSQQNAMYSLTRVPVPSRAPAAPASPAVVEQALSGYGRTLQGLLAGYHILDRNYTYDFHNELFIRQTPLVPHYRTVGLDLVSQARRLRAEADGRAMEALATLPPDDPLSALIVELRDYVAYDFNRAPVLERLSGGFERTPAGLQHAAHLYEGESKFLGARLKALMDKHHVVLEAPATAAVTRGFAESGRAIYEAYAHHIVGF